MSKLRKSTVPDQKAIGVSEHGSMEDSIAGFFYKTSPKISIAAPSSFYLST